MVGAGGGTGGASAMVSVVCSRRSKRGGSSEDEDGAGDPGAEVYVGELKRPKEARLVESVDQMGDAI